MIFDSRIKSEDDIFHYFNRKKAAQFIGKPGYFADYLDYFDDLDARGPKVLTEINDESGCFFSDEAGISGYSYFIPEELLLQKSKILKYRPYKMEEFLREYSIGESIFKIRDKREPEYVYQHLFIGRSKSLVNLGGWSLSLEQLFDKFEIGEGCGPDETWHPFGVLDVSEEYIQKPETIRDELLLCSKEEKNH